MLSFSNPVSGLQLDVVAQSRFIRILEIGLAIILAISLANLVIALFLYGDNNTEIIANVDNLAGMDNNGPRDSTYQTGPSNELIAMFGISADPVNRTRTVQQDLEESDLNLKLRGILINSESGIRLAIIAAENSAEEIYRIGDEIQGAEILNIEPGRVVILNNGNTEALYLDIPEMKADIAKKPVRRAGPVGFGIRQISDNDRIVSQQSLRQQLNNLPSLLRQARAIPYSEEGKNMGFKVVEIQNGSIFDELGIRQEDIIQSVNGTPVRTAEDALNVYRKLRTSRSFQLSVLRDGRSVPLNFSIE